ncbi:MAG: plastocyanin/azurin family copper-binding protein [Actinomycetota bacterium]
MRRLAVAFVVGSALGFVLLPVPALAGGGPPAGECYEPPGKVPERVVFVMDTCFAPRTLRVTTGLPVTWQLHKSFGSHNVHSSDSLFDSGDLTDPFTVRFNEPGTYDYVCTYHSGSGGGMVGKVIVEGDSIGGTDPVSVLGVVTPEDAPEAMLADAENRLARAIAALRNETAEVDAEPVAATAPSAAIGWTAIGALGAVAIVLVRRRGPA